MSTDRAITRPSAAVSAGVGTSARQLAVGAAGVGMIAGAAALGAVELTLVDVVVLLGVAVVLPLALPGRWIWPVAAVGALGSLLIETGWAAALLVAPWLVAAGAATAVTAGRARRGTRPTLDELGPVVASLDALVAGGAFIASRLGATTFGIGEPIVELTAVHYTYAGSAALVLATRAFVGMTGRWRRVAGFGVVLTAAAPVVVAAGFVTHRPLAQVGGAVLMTVGVWCVASLELQLAAQRGRPLGSRILLGVSGVAIWIPMVLAVGWAAGQHGDIPALSIPAMERTHGLANSLAFVLGGLLAWWLIDRSGADGEQPEAIEDGAAPELALVGPVGDRP